MNVTGKTGGESRANIDLISFIAFYQSGKCEESLFDVFPSYSTGGYKEYSFFITPTLYLFQIDSNLNIFFGSKQQKMSIGYSFDGHIIPNILNTFKTFFISQIKDQYYSITRFKICSNYGSKFLLSCGIPNTQFNFLLLNYQRFISEIDGGDKVIKGSLVFYVSPEDRCFTCACITNKDDFVSDFWFVVI